jgi:hypothetical protein
LLDDYIRNGLNPVPSRTDPNDPAYSLKYVHNMPPLKAYKFHTPAMDIVSTETDTQVRTFFYGWNNLTTFETKALQNIKEYLKAKCDKEVP